MISSISNSTSALTSLLSSSTNSQQVRERAAKPPSPEELFAKMDADGDGAVSESELATGMEEMQQTAGSRPPPPPDGEQPPSASELFAKIDADSDGQISLDELKTDFESHRPAEAANTSATPDLSELFSKLDSDSDGKIGESEFAKLLETMSQSRQQSFGKTYTNSAASTSSGSSTSLLGVA
ncbi:MAG: EF-hand domain-containing protein [Opitutaceae bacterium]